MGKKGKTATNAAIKDGATAKRETIRVLDEWSVRDDGTDRSITAKKFYMKNPGSEFKLSDHNPNISYSVITGVAERESGDRTLWEIELKNKVVYYLADPSAEYKAYLETLKKGGLELDMKDPFALFVDYGGEEETKDASESPQAPASEQPSAG